MLLSGCFGGGGRGLFGGGGGIRPVWTAPISTEYNPRVSGGLVYVQGKKTGEDRNRLFALDLKTGAERWASELAPDEIYYVSPQEIAVKDNAGKRHFLDPATGKDLTVPQERAAGTWVYAARLADRVFFLTPGRELAATDGNGKPLWKIPIPLNRFRPILIDNGLIAISGSLAEGEKEKEKTLWSGVFLVAADSGKPIGQWRGQPERALSNVLLTGGTLYFVEEGKTTTHTVVTHGTDGSTSGRTEYGEDENTLHALDTATGKDRWTRKTNGDGDAIGEPLFVEGDTLYLRETGKGEKRFSGIVYRGVAVANGESRSECQLGLGEFDHGPATHEGSVFYTSGKHTNVSFWHPNSPTPTAWVTATDLKAGKESWKSPVVDNTFYTHPVFAEGLVLVGSNAGVGAGPSGVLAFPSKRR